MKDPYFDNTRLSDHRRCGRYFYFRHERDWVPKKSNIPATFGICWHSAQDVVWPLINKNPTLTTSEVVAPAFDAFMARWTQEGLPSIDDIGPEESDRLGARHPAVAMEMLFEYVDQRRDFIAGCELIAVERPFIVPLDPNNPNLFYVGRIDKTIRNGVWLLGVDHKTTASYKIGGPFRPLFIESFSPNSQIDGYLHSLHIDYAGEKRIGLYIDAALVHKKVHDGFKFIPIDKLSANLDLWLWETHQRIAAIKKDRAALKKVAVSDTYMAAFERNTNACGDFGGCPYKGPCDLYSNPTGKECPPGFTAEPWSPFEGLGLEKLGVMRIESSND